MLKRYRQANGLHRRGFLARVDDTVWLNLGLVVFFILLGGVFAAAELALVSLRESQLDALEKRSRRGAAVAKLARDPNTFLAAVQIGVTVSGFFSARFRRDRSGPRRG